MLIPEIVIQTTIQQLLDFVKRDYNGEVDKTNTFLYKAFFGQKVGNFDYYEQAKDLFLRDKNHPKEIGVRMFFDRSRAHLPTIHLSLPSEQGGEGDGIGFDQGYQENIFNSTEREITTVYNRNFNTQYNIIISSDNTFETLLIYHTLRALLISTYESLEMNGLRNPKFGGRDLQLNSDIIPPNVYIRALTLDVFYEIAIPKYVSDKIISNINNPISTIISIFQ